MTTIYHRNPITGAFELVATENPFPVELASTKDLPPVSGRTICRLLKVPGIGTAAAYAAGEAFGGLITFRNVFDPRKKSGTITQVFLLDPDDEGIQVDVPIFVRKITATTDNNAFAITDGELLACRAVLSITEFFNWNVNQFGQYTGSPKWIQGESAHLYTQLVVQGAANIAVDKEPYIGIVVVPD